MKSPHYPSPNPIRVSLVDDDPSVRESLAQLLDCSPGFRCLRTYGSAEAALKSLPLEKPDVLLMDIHLGRIDGIECVRRLKTLLPTLPIIMLTAHEDDELIFQALRAGATGYLVKLDPSAILLESIAVVHRGGGAMSSNIARKVIRSFHHSSPADPALSEREHQILIFLGRGYQYKEIGNSLGITYETVHSHLKNIYAKLHVRNKMEAVAKIRELTKNPS